ncbi:hypothetical protein GW17_00022516 [Ensete ventricosum]|nr:hypothetical protein GW17_00022516 [Ensete ventricosum]
MTEETFAFYPTSVSIPLTRRDCCGRVPNDEVPRRNPVFQSSGSPECRFPCSVAQPSRALPLHRRSTPEMTSTECAASIHEFTVKVGLFDLLLGLEGPFDVGSFKDRILDAKGNGVDLSTYKRKVLQIVNVASECELTNSNYTELSQLYEKYKGNELQTGWLIGMTGDGR